MSELFFNVTDTATPALMGLASGLSAGERRNAVMAQTVLRDFQRHFRRMAATNKNPFGARSSFWNGRISDTRAVASQTAAIIAMHPSLRLRYYGGTVTPKTKKALAIPARREAYGKSPRQFHDLRLAVFKTGGEVVGALVQRQHSKVGWRKDKKTGGLKMVRGKGVVGPEPGRETKADVFFWLRRSVTIRGNRAVLPDGETIAAAAARGVQSYVATLRRRAARRRA